MTEFTAEPQSAQRTQRTQRKTFQNTMSVNEMTKQIIAAAIEVHRALGPGLLESVYEECLCRELSLRGIPFERQTRLQVEFKGLRLECGYRLDLVVASRVVVEIKAVETLLPIHEAQLLTYLKLGGWKVGILINFNVAVLKQGIRRRVLGLQEWTALRTLRTLRLCGEEGCPRARSARGGGVEA